MPYGVQQKVPHKSLEFPFSDDCTQQVIARREGELQVSVAGLLTESELSESYTIHELHMSVGKDVQGSRSCQWQVPTKAMSVATHVRNFVLTQCTYTYTHTPSWSYWYLFSSKAKIINGHKNSNQILKANNEIFITFPSHETECWTLASLCTMCWHGMIIEERAGQVIVFMHG